MVSDREDRPADLGADADENVARRGQPLPTRHRRQASSRTAAELGNREIRRCSIYGTIMDAGAIAAVPLLVAALVFQRRTVAGLTAGWG